MDISFFIAELLHQTDEVSVPYFGTFSKIKVNGFHNPGSDLYFPPSENLSFSRHTDDHEVLAEYISRKKNISINSAKYFVSKFVEQIVSLLDHEGHAELQGLGTLDKNQDGFRFKPVPSLEQATNYFGLFPVKEIYTKKIEDVNSVSEEAAIVTPSSYTSYPEADIQVVEEAETGMKFGTKLFIAASIIILSVLALYQFNPQLFQVLLKPNVAELNSKIPIEPIKKSVPAVVVTDSAKTTVRDTSVAMNPVTVVAKDSTQISNPNQSIATFEIIGAAFAKRKEAETYVKAITAKGLYAKIVEHMPGAKIKVSLGSFTDEQQAELELIRIRKDLNKDAWMTRVKPKKTN
ncbi:SPOR domain-containing protein [Daejeonella oryzae]|uniref:SPOR domain-containing protein n=1 Tax=Daejeonella oryzae TaxID=1122943 RepID=UPI0004077944|nr:SPOR domain-containing protein [Daejeonella oryzae]